MLKRKGSQLNILRPGESNPKSLQQNALDMLVLMEAALGKELFYQVSHMGHIALELAVKAAYAKVFSNLHPWGHELAEICDYEISSGLSLRDKFMEDAQIEKQYLLVRTAWAMQDRYQRRNVLPKDAKNYEAAYREVSQWIFTKYL